MSTHKRKFFKKQKPRKRFSGVYTIMYIWMIVNPTTPGMPRIPEIEEVTRLMGTCMPNWLPKAFKKNKNKAPINTFIHSCPANFAGLNGVPAASRKTIKLLMTAITTTGLIYSPPLR
jgi:hypothetical protein